MSKSLPDIAVALIRSLVISLTAALIMAFVWDVLEWMRTFSAGSPLIPQLSQLQVSRTSANIQWWSAQGFIEWYNLTFLGAARFGTAIGLILGGFYALGTLDKHGLAARVVAGCVIGALMGGRIALLITSMPSFFVCGLVLGALIVGASMGVLSSTKQMPLLPEISAENLFD